MKNQQALTRQPRGFGVDIINQARKPSNSLDDKPKLLASKVPCCLSKTSSQTTMDIQDQPSIHCQSQLYINQVCSYIFSKPSIKLTDYFQDQSQINNHMRGVLLNWLVNVHLKYQLSAQTLFLTVDIIDQFLNRQQVVKKELQLLGITALWIAAKFHEVYQVPKMSNLVYISDNAYTKKDIFDMQSKIMSAIQFNLLQLNLNTYIQLILRRANMEQKDQYFARYFSELCLLDWSIRRKDQKVLSAGIIYLIKRMKKQTYCWNDCLKQMTGVSESEAKSLAKELYLVLFNIEQNPCFHAVRSKYSSDKYLKVGKIIFKSKSE